MVVGVLPLSVCVSQNRLNRTTCEIAECADADHPQLRKVQRDHTAVLELVRDYDGSGSPS